MLLIFFFLMTPPPPRSTLFPYTTLFRSHQVNNLVRKSVQRSCTDAHIAGPLATTEFIWPNPMTQNASLHRLTMKGGILRHWVDRKSTRLNSSHRCISYAVFCLKKKTITE